MPSVTLGHLAIKETLGHQASLVLLVKKVTLDQKGTLDLRDSLAWRDLG